MLSAAMHSSHPSNLDPTFALMEKAPNPARSLLTPQPLTCRETLWREEKGISPRARLTNAGIRQVLMARFYCAQAAEVMNTFGVNAQLPIREVNQQARVRALFQPTLSVQHPHPRESIVR